MPDILLKRWNDWSAGIGHLVDDGRTPGMYYASGLLGLRGELRPAPFFNSLATTGSTGLGTATLSWSMAATDGAAVACTVEPMGGAVTVTLDAISNSKTAAAATLTFAHTCTGTGRVLMVLVATDNIVPTGVTYAGDAMTKVVDEDGGTTGNASIWVLINPDTGANDIVISVAPNDEIVAGGISYTNANQSEPTGHTATSSSAAMLAPSLQVIGVLNGAAVGVVKAENTAVTSGQIETFNDIEGVIVRGVGQRTTVAVGGVTPQYFLEEQGVGGGGNYPFLYIMTGLSDGTAGKLLHKVSIANADFAVLGPGVHSIPTGLPGQPAKYQTDWYIPSGSGYSPAKLDAVGIGDTDDDTFTAGSTPFATGSGDHYANLNFQLVAAVNGAGVYVLKLDGAPQTAADWGSAFQIGDKNTRPTAIRSLQGMSIALKKDGLFSFNEKGRSRLIFEDFNVATSLDQLAMKPWFDGVAIGAPQGLFYYVPGERPINIGFSSRLRSGSPPSGVTELLPGRFLGLDTRGPFIFTIYQPDPTATAALVMYAESLGDPRDADLQWNALGSITLDTASCFAGIHVADSGFPTSTAETVPSLWFSNVGDPRHLALSPTGGPIRSRADTHKVNISADAYMSELFFAEPVELTKLIVHTSADMADGDEFQISIIADGTGRDEKVGPPVKGSGIRHERKLDRHSVSRMVLHVNWVATDATARVPPVITRIELYGGPEKGMASAARPD